MPIVRIPSPLRRLTDGRAEVAVAGVDLRQLVANLEAAHPGLASRLLDDAGDLHGFVHVFVDGVDVRRRGGLDTRLGEDATVAIVPAVAGG